MRLPDSLLCLPAASLAILAGSQVACAATPVESGIQLQARADFSSEAPSADARAVADWVVASRDNGGLPFLIVDKLGARLFLFDPRGRVRAAAPVLLGLARGDDSPPGIGDRKLAAIAPDERITPAGRFVAARGTNLAGQDIVWIDYAAAISLHRATDVKPGLTKRNRLARLKSNAMPDRRISHGCVNVSEGFYDRFIRPTFAGTDGIVYILPETRSVREQFHMPAERGGIGGLGRRL